MNNTMDTYTTVTREDKYLDICPGTYWRKATEPEGTVELIEEIKAVEGQLHTIKLRYPPNNQDRYEKNRWLHVEEFVKEYVFAPDGETIRARELLACQEAVNSLQNELVTYKPERATCSDIVPLDSLEMQNIKLENVSNDSLMSMQRNVSGQLSLVQQHADFISSQTEKIQEAVKRITPFYEEMACKALASISQEQKYAAKMFEAIETLEMFTGKKVEIERICTGISAPDNEPLTILQRKMYADEEMAMFKDVKNYFNAQDIHLFDDCLKTTPEMVNNIFVHQRAVCLMATSRRFASEIKDSRFRAMVEDENCTVFLMIRDGENIFRVFSPIESHLIAHSLVPCKEDQEKIFKDFMGNISTWESIDFAEKMEKHDAFIMHYKRFLLLLAGLDLREKLFGIFHPEGENFISLEFQKKYMRFIFDEDGREMLGTSVKESVYDFFKRLNRSIVPGRGGSRIISDLKNMVTKYSAPGAFSKEHDPKYRGQMYYPENRYGVFQVKETDARLYIEVPMKKEDYHTDKEKIRNIKVFITDTSGNIYQSFGFHSFLHFDMAETKEVLKHLQNRDIRDEYLSFIAFFKEILRNLEARDALYSRILTLCELEDTPLVKRLFHMALAYNDFDISGDKLATISSQILTQFRNAVTGVYYEKALAFAAKKNQSLFHATMLGDGKLAVYLESHEPDSRLEPWKFCDRYVLKQKNYNIFDSTVVKKPYSSLKEVSLPEFEALPVFNGNYIDEKTGSFSSPEAKTLFIENSTFDFHNEECRSKLFKLAMNQARILSKKFVTSPEWLLPIGVERINEKTYALCLEVYHVFPFLLGFCEADYETKLTEYLSLYRNKEFALSEVKRIKENGVLFRLSLFPVGAIRSLPILLNPQDAYEKTFLSGFVTAHGCDRMRNSVYELLFNHKTFLASIEESKRLVHMFYQDDTLDAVFNAKKHAPFGNLIPMVNISGNKVSVPFFFANTTSGKISEDSLYELDNLERAINQENEKFDGRRNIHVKGLKFSPEWRKTIYMKKD